MTYQECLAMLVALLKSNYPNINIESDLGVVNKVEELAYILCRRTNERKTDGL